MDQEILIKYQQAKEKYIQIIDICMKDCINPDDKNLLKIGSLVGDFTNNLRSSLNFAMRFYTEVKLKSLITSRDYKKIKRKTDFPWSIRKKKFDKIKIIEIISLNDTPTYKFLDSIQPYNENCEWLKHFMRISNTDKHIKINKVLYTSLTNIVGFDSDDLAHATPRFVGDKLIIIHSKKPHAHSLPCYYFPFGMFALEGGRWILFLLVIDQTNLGITRFMERSLKEVEIITSELLKPS